MIVRILSILSILVAGFVPLATAYERLNKLKAAGKTTQEAAAVGPLDDLEATWGDGIFKSARWIELIYSGV